eukprot:20088-Chlamydomonas_euryale.AAC.1
MAGAVAQVVMRDRMTMKPRGFGFVTFKDTEAATVACKTAHNIDGRTVSCTVAGEGAQLPRASGPLVPGASGTGCL